MPLTPATFDLTSPAFAADPYPAYRRLLAHSPVFRGVDSAMWYVSGYHDIAALLRHPAVSADYSDRLTAGLVEEQRRDTRMLLDVFSRMTLYRDPPAQSLLHRAIRRAMTPRLLSEIDQHIQELTHALLDAAEGQGGMDLIADLAYPLPATIIAEMLGAPPADRDLFRRWAQDIALFLGVPTSEATVRRVQQTLAEAVSYFRSLLLSGGTRRSADAAPWCGIFARELLATRQQHPELDEDDVVASCVMLVFAGHETTTSLIGNTMLCLLQHPDQMSALRRDLSLLPRALDESVRYESPVQRIGRVARDEVRLESALIPAGAPLTLLLAAGNRDPRVFDRPDCFDLLRADGPNLAFGAGGHRCPGAALALLESRIAVDAVIRRFTGLHMPDAPQWEYNLALRKMRSMPLVFRDAAAHRRSATAIAAT